MSSPPNPGHPPDPQGMPDRQLVPSSRLGWAPRLVETGLAALGGLVMTGLGFTVDPTGRWLVWGAGLLLFGIAALDLAIRPRLQADTSRLVIRTLTGQTVAIWPQVEMNLRQHQRFGRSVATLELDIDDKLIVLGRRELGTDPGEVLAQLIDLRG
ncbi:MAG: PH domain-containing protein [Actinomycetota bacterium]|nr:PH domain-containing protein [Actinomycetota bacterium]